MKKYLALACALACASLPLSSCHDDDENDDDYVADFSSIKHVSYIPGAQTVADKVGLNAFMFSDANGYTDVTSYVVAESGEITTPYVIGEPEFENYYGGFCPTAYPASGEASSGDGSYRLFAPANGTYHSGSSALVCNPGTLCRAIFARRHFAVDMSAAMSAFFVGDMKGLWVAPTAAYEYLTTADGRKELGVTTSPANVEVRFVVYAYIKTLGVTGWQSLVSMFKTNASESDVKSKSYAVLAKTDADGEWTVNKEWQYVDLSDVEDYYVFEADLQVVDAATGKTVSSFQLEDYGDGQNGLNYCMVDDITCGSKGLF